MRPTPSSNRLCLFSLSPSAYWAGRRARCGWDLASSTLTLTLKRTACCTREDRQPSWTGEWEEEVQGVEWHFFINFLYKDNGQKWRRMTTESIWAQAGGAGGVPITKTWQESSVMFNAPLYPTLAAARNKMAAGWKTGLIKTGGLFPVTHRKAAWLMWCLLSPGKADIARERDREKGRHRERKTESDRER